jgi:hypothetical protein
MSLDRRRTVTEELTCKEFDGPLTKTFRSGHEVVILHYFGHALESVVFATLGDVLRCTSNAEPKTKYEAPRDLFDSSTAPTS